MVQEIYRKRIKYTLESSYELQVNLELLREEIIQDTAALKILPSPKTTRFGPESEGGSSNRNQSPEEAFCLKKEESLRRLEMKKERYYSQRLLLERVDKGLQRMPGDCAKILRWKSGYKSRRMTWHQIANRLGENDPSYCRRRYNEALDILTGIVYGVDASPVQGVLDIDTSSDQDQILNAHISTDFDKRRQISTKIDKKHEF